MNSKIPGQLAFPIQTCCVISTTHSNVAWAVQCAEGTFLDFFQYTWVWLFCFVCLLWGFFFRKLLLTLSYLNFSLNYCISSNDSFLHFLHWINVLNYCATASGSCDQMWRIRHKHVRTFFLKHSDWQFWLESCDWIRGLLQSWGNTVLIQLFFLPSGLCSLHLYQLSPCQLSSWRAWNGLVWTKWHEKSSLHEKHAAG